MAKLDREFKRAAPKKELTNLQAIIEDFFWRFTLSKRDMVIMFAEHSDDLKTAIQRAVRSRDERGKMWNHQTRVRKSVLDEMENRLTAPHRMKRMKACEDFHELFEMVDAFKIHGLGPVSVYDFSVRIGAYLGLEPEHVYLHAGPRMGAKALGLAFEKGYLTKSDLPKELRRLKPDDAEDILCAYRTVFTKEMA